MTWVIRRSFVDDILCGWLPGHPLWMTGPGLPWHPLWMTGHGWMWHPSWMNTMTSFVDDRTWWVIISFVDDCQDILCGWQGLGSYENKGVCNEHNYNAMRMDWDDIITTWWIWLAKHVKRIMIVTAYLKGSNKFYSIKNEKGNGSTGQGRALIDVP